ncbi:hypothetical protein CBR_g39927 [Chara braunii]|uniref:Ubiquitin-like modifier-activating enzyme ATG7 n=1 Tax=Chara braunii TaxID=69332 RepID=A0A388K1U2_CHABU|nr:hypothetical protein CBR_g39927 [Chara braunii]|eukprot:GBG63923.1 hypothetical protein CBR_g39927 [Chara braunii]
MAASLRKVPSSVPSEGQEEPKLLQFAPWQSSVEVGFWEHMARAKMDMYRLSDAPRQVIGFFSPCSHDHVPSCLRLLSDSLCDDSILTSLSPKPSGSVDDISSASSAHVSSLTTPSASASSSSTSFPVRDSVVGETTHRDGLESMPALPLDGTSSSPVIPAVIRESVPLDRVFGNRNRTPSPGVLLNKNTLEEFKGVEKTVVLKACAREIWDDILSGRAEKDPSLLNRFLVLSFADLKGWKFYYWFAFPALSLREPARLLRLQSAAEAFAAQAEEDVARVSAACRRWRDGHSIDCVEEVPSVPAAAASLHGDSTDPSVESSASLLSPFAVSLQRQTRVEEVTSGGAPFFLIGLIPGKKSVLVASLHGWEDVCHDVGGPGNVVVAFFDPCHLPTHPGWPLRNLLVLASVRWRVQRLRVLCYRERKGRFDPAACPVIDVLVPPCPEETPGGLANLPCPEAVGWEKNRQGKMSPRLVDLSPVMDSRQLALAAADLNLKLMRWRLLPSLNISVLNKCRCLLLGAGTLGCQVARGLMAWGVRQITIVDYGRVSMSNPLRQSLYELEDCLGGGKPKALAAAERLQRIFPGVTAKGIQMAIPMPGHPVLQKDEESVSQICKDLKQLIDDHDAIFLLTDTRESRWLPTLMCASANKLAINVALGFDTFLVMRHGSSPSSLCPSDPEGAGNREWKASDAESKSRDKVDGISSRHSGHEEAGGNLGVPPEDSIGPPIVAHGKQASSKRLGCYFCNDVVAPLDSTTNRTLDQQCTVTRPGLAPIAAALAVELVVSLLHHPLGVEAAADQPMPVMVSTDLPLGIIPHQVRGFLAHFAQMMVVGEAFDRCTACSHHVVDAYRRRREEFLLRVFNDPLYLEELSGLTKLKAAAHDACVDWDEEEQEDEEE